MFYIHFSQFAMEYDAGKTKPEPNRTFLVQQVNEQSNVCDVTVKMGVWVCFLHYHYYHYLNSYLTSCKVSFVTLQIKLVHTISNMIYIYCHIYFQVFNLIACEHI
jgi:hypothetical protein